MSNQINTRDVLRGMANACKLIDEATETNLTRTQGRQVDNGLKALDEGMGMLRGVLQQAEKDAASVTTLTAKLDEANKDRADKAIKLVDLDKALAASNVQLVEAGAEIKALTAKLAQCNEQTLKTAGAETPELVKQG